MPRVITRNQILRRTKAQEALSKGQTNVRIVLRRKNSLKNSTKCVDCSDNIEQVEKKTRKLKKSNQIPNIETKEQRTIKKTKSVSIRDNSPKKGSRAVIPETKKVVLRSHGSKITKNATTTRSKTKIPVNGLHKNENVRSSRVTKIKKSNTSTGLRQISLKESFSNQAIAKRLRPRQDQKNYCEDTTLLHKYLSPEQHSSIVVINKLRGTKAPIYKCINMIEETRKNGSDIYDFKFDDKNPKERIRKTKKKTGKATVKNVNKHKSNMKKTKKSQATEEKVSDGTQLKKPKNENPSNNLDKKYETCISEKPAQNLSEEIENSIQAKEENKQIIPVQKTSDLKNEKSSSRKPVIISVENLNKTKITVIPSPTKLNKNFTPFRPVSAFSDKHKQYKNMMNHSLLKKPLSPILKLSQDFDLGSPWRPPPVGTFSQVKDLFQSTPQNNTVNVFYARVSQPTNIDFGNTDLISDVNNVVAENNENVLKKNFSAKNKNPSTLSRKFGAEIGNVDYSVQSVSNNTIGEQNERSIIEAEQVSMNNWLHVHNSRNSSNFSMYNDDNEDKENAAPNYQTPRKTLKRRLNKQKNALNLQKMANLNSYQLKENINTLSMSTSFQRLNSHQGEKSLQFTDSRALPLKENLDPQPGPSGLQKIKSSEKDILLQQTDLSSYRLRENLDLEPGPSNLRKLQPEKEGNKSLLQSNSNSYQLGEHVDPQPGPSGLQKAKSREKEKILQQSNLNSFLNIVEMPERVQIRTIHGIFDDAHSTPINGKSVKKMKEVEPNIENAFGFVDDEFTLDISPINSESQTGDAQREKENVHKSKMTTPLAPARLTIGEIKNKLLKKKPGIEVEDKKEVEKHKVKTDDIASQRKEKVLVNISNFFDTFDVVSEMGEPQSDVSDVLFADIEPTHFTKPPKHSYKRKRAVRFSFSEDSGDEDEPKLKKKRVGKETKKDNKRLQQWVKSVNETFQEIDQYDLVIE